MPVYNHYFPDGTNKIQTPESATRLAAYGPCIPVSVSVTPDMAQIMQQRNIPVPPAVSGLALIDTGASLCCIDEEALTKLGIPPFGYQQVSTPTGTTNQNTYAASLSFPGTPIPDITFVDFAGSTLANQGILVLIGRNVLKEFVLVYNGPGGHMSLAF